MMNENQKNNANRYERRRNRYEETEKKAPYLEDESEEDELTEVDLKKMMKEIKDEYEREIIKEELSKSVKEQVKDWLTRVSYLEFRDAICETVIGQEGVEFILLSVYYYLSALAKGKKHRNHVLVAAPSGCGKSATYLALREYFSREIPALVINRSDISNITEAAYKGDDPITILRPLFEKAPKQNGEGILFLDEFDKKIVPSTSNRGENTNLAIQGQLLTMLEGCSYREEKNASKSVDTANTLFIAMGSFDEVRRNRKGKAEESKITIGFNQGKDASYDHFEEVTREDILKMGASYELMGRFPMLVNFHPLSAEVINVIIRMECDKVETLLGTSIMLSPSFQKELGREANGPFGCRDFYNRIYTLSIKACHELLLEGGCPEESVIYLKNDGAYEFRKKKAANQSGR